MRKPRSAKPLSKVRVKDKVSRFNSATVHSWMCYFTRLGPMMDFQILFREVGARAFISDHITQQDTRVCLLAVILQFRQSSHGKLTPFWRVCLPVQLYHSPDKCLNEREFMFMKESGMSILPPPWVLQTLHPVQLINYDKLWNFCINDASEDGDSEDIHLECLAFMVTWEELKTLQRGVAGRKSIR